MNEFSSVFYKEMGKKTTNLFIVSFKDGQLTFNEFAKKPTCPISHLLTSLHIVSSDFVFKKEPQ